MIPFWKYLKDESFVIENMKLEAIEEVDIEGKAAGKELAPHNFVLSINGAPVSRLSRLDLSVWVGNTKPGMNLKLTFAIPQLDEDGNVKEIKKVVCRIGPNRIRGAEFDLTKIDDIAEDKINGEKKAIPTDVQT